jgi:RNA polymerase sigma-70 factor (ECF subfamily)
MATVRLALSGLSGGESTSMAADLGARLEGMLIDGSSRTGSSDAERMSERRLLRAAQDGSEEALEVLVRRNWPLAHRAAYLVIGDAVAAEDVAQEALVAAIRSLGSFDRRRPFGPWLHRIAVNRAIDHARARAARAEVSAGTAVEAERRGPPRPGDESGSDPRGEGLGAAMRGLTPEHRAIVAMRYLLDLTPGEIAGELGLPRGTVNSRLRRALDQLAGTLEGSS